MALMAITDQKQKIRSNDSNSCMDLLVTGIYRPKTKEALEKAFK